MDIKEMKLFLAIAEEKNLTRAAKKNGYTQSGASHILKKLERELGFSVCTRSQKGLVLTRNGEALLPYLRRILFAAEYFEQKVSFIKGVQKGHITIGVYLSASIRWLPAALEQFSLECPHIIVEIREGTFQQIEDWLENGCIDFGICGPSAAEKMEWIPLKTEHYMAVCPLHSPYTEDACFDLRNLEKVSYIEEKNEEDLFRQFREFGICPLPRYSSSNLHSMIAMVKHNLGVCILPELAIDKNPQDVRILPLNPPLERLLGIRLPTLKKASPAVRMLVSQLQKTVGETEPNFNLTNK